MTKHFLKAGDQIGHLRLIQVVHRGKKVSASLRKQWRVECQCGKRLTIPEAYLVRENNPRTHCGCQDAPKTLKTLYNREYRIWCMMRQRCYFKTHVAYKNYGGRGIGIAPQWLMEHGGFESFLEYIGPAPTPKHSVDRIDNNKGYEPNNVRWSTSEQQAHNTRAYIAKHGKPKTS